MIECRYIYSFFLNQKIYVDCALHSQYKMQTKLITKLDTAHWTTLRDIRVDVRHDDYAAFIHRRAKISRV